MDYFAIGMTCSGIALGLLAGCILLRVFRPKVPEQQAVKPKEPSKPKQNPLDSPAHTPSRK